MVLRVRYTDEKYDYVNGGAIDGLIDQKRIRTFFRPSERTWVDVEAGATRKHSDVFYIGPERRNPPAVA